VTLQIRALLNIYWLVHFIDNNPLLSDFSNAL